MNKIDIIIFAGQSNMQGETEVLSENDIVDGAFEYKYINNSIVSLKNPVGENITCEKASGKDFNNGDDLSLWLDTHLTGSSVAGHTNMVPEFCRKYIEATSKHVLAIHIAKRCTKIDYWLPEADGYVFLKEKVIAAKKFIEYEYIVENIFVVWLQGESDQIVGKTKQIYKRQIIHFKDALKKDIGIDRFGIIRVGRFTNDERDMEIIDAQDEVCIENDDFLMLTQAAVKLNQLPEYMNPFVAGHYSAKGLEKLGKEGGRTLGAYVSGQQKVKEVQ